MKHIITPFLILSLLLASLSSCVRLDFDENDKPTPPTPAESKISLSTDWSQRTEGIGIPSNYYVAINNNRLEFKNATNQLPNYPLGTYNTIIYNLADKVSVTDLNVAEIETSNNIVSPFPGWLFSSSLDIAYNNTNQNLTANMIQQTRELNIVVSIIGNGTLTPLIIEGQISGIANKIDLKNNSHIGEGIVVKTTFSKGSNNFKSQVRLIGMTTESNILIMHIQFSDGTTKTLNIDITNNLAGFNQNKHIPMTVSIEHDLSVGNTNIKTNISDWNFN